MKEKRILLKGDYPCILTIDPTGTITREWLHTRTDEPLLLFSRAESAPLQGTRCALPPSEIIAASIGAHTKGQLAPFDFEKAWQFLQHDRSPAPSELPYDRTPTPPEPMPAPAPRKENPPTKRNCPCAPVPQCMSINPFPREFPDSDWLRHEYPTENGSWHYLTGNIRQNGSIVATATAVPGRTGAKPPAWLKEFSRFLYCPDTHQGYWIAVHTNQSITEEE